MSVDPYSLIMDIPPMLWMTTVGTETVSSRAARRASLRRRGRLAWGQAIDRGARPVDRFLLLVNVGGRGAESPVLAAETVKPLVDAGTDRGLWPDDDPWHRVATCYLTDPRPSARPRVSLTVIPLGARSASDVILGACHNPKGLLREATIPDDEWITSNMRLDARTRAARQSAIMRRTADLWADVRFDRAAVLCWVRYPDSRRRYKGDPDNTAESATAMWGSGALTGALPARPGLFGFLLAAGQSRPKTHDLTMLAFDPGPVSWMGALIR